MSAFDFRRSNRAPYLALFIASLSRSVGFRLRLFRVLKDRSTNWIDGRLISESTMGQQLAPYVAHPTDAIAQLYTTENITDGRIDSAH